MLKPEFTGQFKRDYKAAVRRGCDPRKLEQVVALLCAEQPLPASSRDHALTNSRNYKHMREMPYPAGLAADLSGGARETLILKLIRTGTHSDLF